MDFFEILLSGVFGKEITVSSFASALKEAGGKNLRFVVSSPGGNVSEASAISYMLRDYVSKNDAKVEFKVAGAAQSAMSYLTALDGGVVTVFPTSIYMMHNPYTIATGDHNEFSRQSAFLSSLTDAYAGQYSAKSGKGLSEVKEAMNNTTVLVGQQIVDAGYADVLEGDPTAIDDNEISALAYAAKEDFNNTMRMVNAAALGVDSGIDKNQINKGEIGMDKKIKKENTPSASATEVNQPAVISDDARTAACMDALAKCPEDSELLRNKFVAGASADYFNGFMDHKDQISAVASADAATEESINEIGEVQPKAQETSEPTKVRTYGATGQKVSV
jgi:ATP-dependent Clp protease protease subunit